MWSRNLWSAPMLLIFLCVITLPGTLSSEAPPQTIGKFHGKTVSAITHLQCPEEVSQESENETRDELKARTLGAKTSLYVQILRLLVEAVRPHFDAQNFLFDSHSARRSALLFASAQGTRGPPKP